MRLIDADLLLEELNGFSMRIIGSANAMAIVIMDETKKSIAKMVDEQPTAYDVDKVVDRVNEMSGIQFDGKNESYQLDWCIDTGSAIKIIKSGGID